eukprot:scaffold991_cov128-Cylindrotheca_fusiformis.AAC.23
MASASTIPPTHVGTHRFQQDEGDLDPMEFPELNEGSDEWELISKPPPPRPAQVTFDSKIGRDRSNSNPKTLFHSQSSPNLGEYVIESSESSNCSENEDDDEQDAAATTKKKNKAAADDASSTFSMVSGPPSVNSIWSSRISFKDALLKKGEPGIPEDSTTTTTKRQHSRRIRKVKPKFVVAEVVPMKHAKSTGDLLSLDEEEVLGETDAHEYYSRKELGSLGRKNGKKQRPDEAKRLQITMNKKNLQRAQQGR